MSSQLDATCATMVGSDNMKHKTVELFSGADSGNATGHRRRLSCTLTVASDDEDSEDESHDSVEKDASVTPPTQASAYTPRYSPPSITGRPRSSSTNTLGLASYRPRGRTLAPPDHLRRELRTIASASLSRSPSPSFSDMSSSSSTSPSSQGSPIERRCSTLITSIQEENDEETTGLKKEDFLLAPQCTHLHLHAQYVHCRNDLVFGTGCAYCSTDCPSPLYHLPSNTLEGRPNTPVSVHDLG